MRIKSIISNLHTPIAAAPLISFKLVFGALLIFSTLRFMWLGWIEDHYVQPLFHFKYWGFEWVPVLSLHVLYAVHILLILSALGIMFLNGWAYRIAAIVLFLTFTYTELIDLTYYLNHYYFVSIICFILIFLPSHCSPFLPLHTQFVDSWAILIIKLQIAVLYVYAGLAKINYDWLINALPLKIWLPANDTIPLIGPLLSWEITPYIFSWMGMLFDTFIIVFLVLRKTRIGAYLVLVFFHTITGLMFQIGVFPLVMMGITLVFFSNEWHIKFIRFFVPLVQQFKIKSPVRRPKQAVFYFLAAFMLFQLLFPWRYLLYPGNLFWTEEGYRFSWRVMLMEKAGTATFYVKDGQTMREGIVDNSEFLNPHQEKQMAMQPDMILQFAHFLGEHYRANGLQEPAVRAEVYVTLNARPGKLLIDPSINLLKEKDSFKPKKWIIHYQD